MKTICRSLRHRGNEMKLTFLFENRFVFSLVYMQKCLFGFILQVVGGLPSTITKESYFLELLSIS